MGVNAVKRDEPRLEIYSRQRQPRNATRPRESPQVGCNSLQTLVIRVLGVTRLRSNTNASKGRPERESVTAVTTLEVWKKQIVCVVWSTCGGFVVDG
jgi:hypothetical protein